MDSASSLYGLGSHGNGYYGLLGVGEREMQMVSHGCCASALR